MVAVLLATAVTAVLPARADARAEHCKASCRHCQASGVMTCCDNERSEPSTLPTQASTTASPSHHSLAVPALAGGALAIVATISTPALLLLGPPHGHRSIDLPILNSVFLI